MMAKLLGVIRSAGIEVYFKRSPSTKYNDVSCARQYRHAIVNTSIIFNRLKAFGIDYIIIIMYAVLLFVLNTGITNTFHFSISDMGPATGELVGFLTLTLPVILYFTVSENSGYAATVGKRKFHLRVIQKNNGKAGFVQLLTRNCLKFLPWEGAHFFIYRLYGYESLQQPAPGWVSAGLTSSQVLALVYVLFMVFGRNHRSIYELLSGTKVVMQKDN